MDDRDAKILALEAELSALKKSEAQKAEGVSDPVKTELRTAGISDEISAKYSRKVVRQFICPICGRDKLPANTELEEGVNK